MTRDSIRALLDAATPGPWRFDVQGHGDGKEAASAILGEELLVVSAYNGHCCSFPIDIDVTPEDAAFIAASRTAVPLLLAVADAAAALRPGDLHAAALDGIEYPEGSPEHRVRTFRTALAALEAA